MLHSSQDVQSPGLHPGILIAQTFERNSYFHFVAAIDEPALGFEIVVRVEVDAALERIDVPESSATRLRTTGTARELRTARPVLLDAVRIHPKEKSDLPAIVGVEQDLDLIFAVDVVS